MDNYSHEEDLCLLRHRTLSSCCICVEFIPGITMSVEIHQGQPWHAVLSFSLARLCIVRHLSMTCCYNSRTQRIQYSIFSLSLANHRRNNTLGFLKLSWSFGSIRHQHWCSGVAGAGWWHYFVFNFLEQIREPLFGFHLFGFWGFVFLIWEYRSKNETSRLTW